MTKKPHADTSKRQRRPHNARRLEFASIEELLALMATELRTVRLGDREMNIPRIEILWRMRVTRALNGNVRELKHLLRLMAKRPALAGTVREEIVTVISGALARA